MNASVQTQTGVSLSSTCTNGRQVAAGHPSQSDERDLAPTSRLVAAHLDVAAGDSHSLATLQITTTLG